MLTFTPEYLKRQIKYFEQLIHWIDYKLHILPDRGHPLLASCLKVKKSSLGYYWKLRLLLLVAMMDAKVL